MNNIQFRGYTSQSVRGYSPAFNGLFKKEEKNNFRIKNEDLRMSKPKKRNFLERFLDKLLSRFSGSFRKQEMEMQRMQLILAIELAKIGLDLNEERKKGVEKIEKNLYKNACEKGIEMMPGSKNKEPDSINKDFSIVTAKVNIGSDSYDITVLEDKDKPFCLQVNKTTEKEKFFYWDKANTYCTFCEDSEGTELTNSKKDIPDKETTELANMFLKAIGEQEFKVVKA